MTSVLLVHSALGLRPAAAAYAGFIREQGHEVHAPDLFDGLIFEGDEAGYDAGVGYVQAHRDELTGAVDEAFAAISGPVVVAGMSFGAMHAQRLALTHGGSGAVLGALLIGGGGLEDGETWPAAVPLALHHCIDDPWVDAEPLAALVRAVTAAGCDVSDYVYPGAGHLFHDDGLPAEFDPVSAHLLRARTVGFLSRF